MPIEFLWTFAVQEGLKKVVKLAAGEIGVAWGLEKELSKLSKWLLKAEAILRDIDIKKLHHDSVRLWVDDLEDVVREADDLLDELAYEDLRRKVETEKLEVSHFRLPSIDPLVFRLETAKKIKDITETLREQFFAASPLGLVSIESTETETDLSQIRETTSDLDDGEVVGREIEVSKIVKQVIDARNQQVTSILPIVGMGGLGKTTLARLVFHHEAIKRHFDKAIWVCVSEPFVIDEILGAMLETQTDSTPNKRENLVRRLQEELEDKRYFLVLDDVWNENVKLWNLLKNCLLKITKKSENSIIVTTRSDKVAEIMGTLPRHYLEKLSVYQCWSLFKESANANGLPMTPKLEVIREKLIKKIGGVPLAARLLGGAIKFQGNYKRWAETLETLINNIPSQDETSLLSILKLSVDRLPSPSLKQCFAYSSNFPKDHEFNKEELIQMWIAQGFIQPQAGRGNESMEDTADKYFNILLSRFLFQDIVKDNRGGILSCKIHDLIHDIACAISNSQNLQSKPNNFWDEELCTNYSKNGAREVRTLIWDEDMFHSDGMIRRNTEMIFHNTIKNFLRLRVLVLGFSISKVPYIIGKLKHLRYLDISNNYIEEFPESIGVLYHLQTLRLGGTVLPKNLRKLISLRHLRFLISHRTQMPPHLSRLIELQTFHSFIIGFEKGCNIEELGPLKNLKGKLKLYHLDRVKNKGEAMAAKLVEKENLRRLHLEWTMISYTEGRSNNNDVEVLEGLQPHKKLQYLSISGFPGQCFPNSILFQNLVTIKLRRCERCEMLPMLGQLPNLEKLKILFCGSVRSIGNEFYGNDSNQGPFFPKLKMFCLAYMANLEQWEEVPVVSEGTIFFPHLERMIIGGCPKLMGIPNLFGCPRDDTCLEFLEISECPNLTLNFQNMHNLKELHVGGCMEEHDFSPLIHLPSLTKLLLDDDRKSSRTDDLGRSATQLPQQLEHLTALRSLTIQGFHGIEALPEWLGNLTSLEKLKICSCRNLKYLPSKEAMLRLTNLNHLVVDECEQLQLDEGDPERAKVSHVPHIDCLYFSFQF